MACSFSHTFLQCHLHFLSTPAGWAKYTISCHPAVPAASAHKRSAVRLSLIVTLRPFSSRSIRTIRVDYTAASENSVHALLGRTSWKLTEFVTQATGPVVRLVHALSGRISYNLELGRWLCYLSVRLRTAAVHIFEGAGWRARPLATPKLSAIVSVRWHSESARSQKQRLHFLHAGQPYRV